MTKENNKEIYSDNNNTEIRKQNLNNNSKINLYNKLYKEKSFNNNSFNDYLFKNKTKSSFDNNIILNNSKMENNIIENHKIDDNENIIPKYNKHIMKSQSYFIEKNSFDKYKRDKYYNESFSNRYKIYKPKKEKEKIADKKNNNSNNHLSIEYLMELVDYNGKINNFPKYLKELKLKADITTLAQNMIKNEINNNDRKDKYFEIKEKNKTILNAYKLILNKLKAEKDIKSTKKEYNNLYNDLYLSQYSS